MPRNQRQQQRGGQASPGAPSPPPGGMGEPPGGMMGGPPGGMMGAPPGMPPPDLEVDIRPYKAEDHKEVFQLFRNAVTDDTLEVINRETPEMKRNRRLNLLLGALLFFVYPLLFSSSDPVDAVWSWVTKGLIFIVALEIILDVIIWLDHGQLYVWNVVDNDMKDAALSKFTTAPNRFFVACDPNNPQQKDMIVGCVALYAEDDGKTARIRRMGVIAEYRQAGVGKKLCQKLIETAKKQGFKKVRVETMSSRKAGLALYKSVGLEQVKEQGRCWGRINMSRMHGITDIHMETKLE